MLPFRPGRSFGIDIGTQTIKIAELQKSRGKFFVSNYSIWRDDLDSIIQEKDGKRGLSVEQVSWVIRNMMESSHMSIKEAYIGIPSYLAFASVMTLPVMSMEDLQKAVPLEAKQYIPVSLDSVQIDWINLGASKTEGKLNIFLIAIPNKVVSRYVKISDLLKITIKGFELDIFSLIRGMQLYDENVCIIDVGARTSTVSIVDNQRQLQMMQSFDFGGNQITNKIADQLGVASQEAEDMKVQYGITMDTPITSIVRDMISQFLEGEALRIVDIYQKDHGVVKKVILTGGWAYMNGLLEYVSSVVRKAGHHQLDVVVGSPREALSIKGFSDVGTSVRIWSDLSLAIGGALREYNI